ncbi:hypothetical protein LB505_004470 [Fusarium chuoi]|nr:hypothetical protein LB505_004470 [Fusarium chuoi]
MVKSASLTDMLGTTRLSNGHRSVHSGALGVCCTCQEGGDRLHCDNPAAFISCYTVKGISLRKLVKAGVLHANRLLERFDRRQGLTSNSTRLVACPLSRANVHHTPRCSHLHLPSMGSRFCQG